ncbi:MAG: carboxypeptidase M32 [Planctomycetes bacterium]|nr:carboxypeptidase M32 [Planctomycetota bacterium]
MTSRPPYDQLVGELREGGVLESVQCLLEWDQETLMPPRGAERRAEEIALLSRIIHEKKTAPRVGELLDRAAGEKDLGPDARANLREARRHYERARKLPADLVAEIARTRSLACEAWKAARRANDFPKFAPWLEKTFHLAREKASRLGWKDSPYDALLEEHEPGMTTARLVSLFGELRKGLVPLVKAIAGSRRRPDRNLLSGKFPAAHQEEFARRVATDLGLDFSGARLDRSAHPFCMGLTPDDVRITTRYNESDCLSALFGVIHETGHALYDQGIAPELVWTPIGQPRSLGVHESQSRLWENQVGRSRAFWSHYLPLLSERFPSLSGVAHARSGRGADLDRFHFAVNQVEPSLIRTEADEVTYNLHILLRFDIERDLLAGELAVSDLPDLWRSRMASDLGVRPDTDADGVLQDIHWSIGLVAYFPTYTLGNMLAAQLHARARADIPDLEVFFARGEFRPLLDWLRDRIHRHGSRYETEELVQRAVGTRLSTAPFLDYLRAKYSPLYGIS